MSETKPRDLTAEELALLQTAGAASAQTAPLPIPPGTDIPIERLNPVAETAMGAPNLAPGQMPGAK